METLMTIVSGTSGLKILRSSPASLGMFVTKLSLLVLAPPPYCTSFTPGVQLIPEGTQHQIPQGRPSVVSTCISFKLSYPDCCFPFYFGLTSFGVKVWEPRTG
jgi:hypothetical protein